MENTNNKILAVSFMIAGVLVGIIFAVALDTAAAVSSGSVSHILSKDIFRHGLPVLAGLVAYAALQFNTGVVHWADEAATELLKVVWPTRQETLRMTITVCVMVVLSGIFFGVADTVSASAVDWLLHQTFFGLFS